MKEPEPEPEARASPRDAGVSPCRRTQRARGRRALERDTRCSRPVETAAAPSCPGAGRGLRGCCVQGTQAPLQPCSASRETRQRSRKERGPSGSWEGSTARQGTSSLFASQLPVAPGS
ncbi:hypothetical protein KIL84_002658 [Mauremys mutica]|uniref:Uncharacterized protein n=1 Tax=Mauremys mutica TaxID=74926 RepID=A0A9D4ASU6_9SAUR|nr:hypothetical protein KIL84_002658 [Mauremys mutica]